MSRLDASRQCMAELKSLYFNIHPLIHNHPHFC